MVLMKRESNKVKVSNLPSGLLKTQLERCIYLLGEEYSKIDYTIKFFSKKREFVEEKRNNPAKTYVDKLGEGRTVAGITIADTREIIILLYQFDEPMVNKGEMINLIATIFHEMRHAWQFDKMAPEKLLDKDSSIFSLENYFEEEYEKDAYLFQLKQMNKHMAAIKRICNIKQNIHYELKEEIMTAINKNA